MKIFPIEGHYKVQDWPIAQLHIRLQQPLKPIWPSYLLLLCGHIRQNLQNIKLFQLPLSNYCKILCCFLLQHRPTTMLEVTIWQLIVPIGVQRANLYLITPRHSFYNKKLQNPSNLLYYLEAFKLLHCFKPLWWIFKFEREFKVWHPCHHDYAFVVCPCLLQY
jgi:hypothetical protein